MNVLPLVLMAALAMAGSAVAHQAGPVSLKPHALYEHAMAQLALLPHKFHGRLPIYTHENLHRGIHVPQYDTRTQDYLSEYPPSSSSSASDRPPDPVLESALETLSSASNHGFAPASVALADIYTFGNYSVPANYSLALAYYHKAVQTLANGHAYFMLGFMYSTGLFGELPVDKQRAKIYYEFAARNGNTNALLVVANQLLHGIGCAANCELAQFYYAKVARQVVKYLDEARLDFREPPLLYNINLADFGGGLYREKISESDSSVLTEIDNFIQLRDTLREKNLDSPDTQILDYYFSALEHFHGGYFSPRNTTRAYVDATTCAARGKAEFADRVPHALFSIDELIWGRCQSLLGRMYLHGEGVERNLMRAYYWLEKAVAQNPDKENLLDMALLRQFDPTSDGMLSAPCKKFLLDAATNGSSHGLFLYAKSLVAPGSPFETTYLDLTFDLIRKSAYKGHYQATFYLADAVESGFTLSKGETFTCTDLLRFYKDFVERSESVLLPHLAYAFEELKYGNYKNALLGYLMAAEQGLLYSQVSAAYLLFQMEPLFSRTRKTFSPIRVQSALTYLELASLQGHIDSTILLGDLYSKGLHKHGLSVDYAKAFAYYSTATLAASAHACYKLGYMYEYGLGCPNNSLDYYMAKRYYDLSVKYYLDYKLTNLDADARPNTYAIGFALLRLRLKLLFSKTEKRDDVEASEWLGTLKKLTKSKESEVLNEKSTKKVQAHAEGAAYDEQEDYQLFDYIVLIFTLAFFLYVGFQNLRGQFRRVGQRPNVGDADHDRDDQAERADRPRFQVEFFFAI